MAKGRTCLPALGPLVDLFRYLSGLTAVKSDSEIFEEEDSKCREDDECLKDARIYKTRSQKFPPIRGQSEYPPSLLYLIWILNGQSFPRWLYEEARREDGPGFTSEWRLQELNMLYSKCDVISGGYPLSGSYIRDLLGMIDLQNRIDRGDISGDIGNAQDLRYLRNLRLPAGDNTTISLHFRGEDDIMAKLEPVGYIKEKLRGLFDGSPEEYNAASSGASYLDAVQPSIRSGHSAKECGLESLIEKGHNEFPREELEQAPSGHLNQHEEEEYTNVLDNCHRLANALLRYRDDLNSGHLEAKSKEISAIRKKIRKLNTSKNPSLKQKLRVREPIKFPEHIQSKHQKLKKLITNGLILQRLLNVSCQNVKKKTDLVNILENIGVNLTDKSKNALSVLYTEMLKNKRKEEIKLYFKPNDCKISFQALNYEDILQQLAVLCLHYEKEYRTRDETESDIISVLETLGMNMTKSTKRRINKLYTRLIKSKKGKRKNELNHFKN